MAKAFTPPVNRVISVSKSRLKGLSAWGDTNLFPQILTEVVKASVTASTCFDVKRAFIEGDGFQDKELSQRIVHPNGLQLDQVLGHTARNVALGEVVPMHVTFNALGYKVGFRPFDYEMARLGMPNDNGEITHVGICPFLNNPLHKKRDKQFTLCHLFNDDRETVLRQIAEVGGIQNYTGQVLYAPLEDSEIDYHVPSYFSGGTIMEVEPELHEFDLYSVLNGFNNAGVFAYLAGEKVKDPNYNPLEDPTSMESQFQNSMGAKKAGAVTTFAAASLEELKAMNFLDFAGKSGIADRYNSTNERAPITIARAWNVPPELANIRTDSSVFPNEEVLKNACRYMQWKVNRPQRHVKMMFEKLLKGMNGSNEPTPDCTIANLDYFKQVATTGEQTQAGQ